MAINSTHNADLKSWVEAANDPMCSFSIQNLPYGVFNSTNNSETRIGVAIGDHVLDLNLIEKAGLLPTTKPAFNKQSLNTFMAMGPKIWSKTRQIISQELSNETSDFRIFSNVLIPLKDVNLFMPFTVSDYTDFYASREHATNVGTMFRGADNALMPNWLHMPIGYNGRASTVAVSGTDVTRPRGQIKLPGSDTPLFQLSQKLDIELEMGAVIGTPSDMGSSINVDQAQKMIFGYVLLNDWSARDIQVWEYQPLGPFLGKAFATTISPWVVTTEALEPFRVHGPSQNPAPLDYLKQVAPLNYDIELEVKLQSTIISKTTFQNMYWSSAQQLAHHSSGGCAMRTGDMLGSGTISGSDPKSMGSLLELSWNGENIIELDDGTTRTFLEDGYTITLSGYAQVDGFRIGFGYCTGSIKPPRA